MNVDLIQSLGIAGTIVAILWYLLKEERTERRDATTKFVESTKELAKITEAVKNTVDNNTKAMNSLTSKIESVLNGKKK